MKVPKFLILVTWLAQNFNFTEQTLDWWQRAVFYQIFPSSFKDSNGDGMGDLGGILDKMDFFTDMGVDAIWLSPIYKSPMVDGGYDISDYYDIAPQYGNISTFEKLVAEAHKRGLKVILDFVPNHTSNMHAWFQKSEQNNAKYKDYYVWENCIKNPNGSITYPNNWLSVWGGSMWQYSETRKQCYLHQFSYQQPDLNFAHPPVHDEMKKVMTYWLDKGVDGFRVDAVPHIYESSNHSANEPINPNSGLPPDNYNYLSHTLTKDQPESKQLIYDWRNFIDTYTKKNNGSYTRILMTEAATDLENSVDYYGTKNGSQLGAHFSFNFWLIGKTNKTRPDDIYNAISSWSNALPKIYTMNWLTGNHDNPRIATTVSPRNADGYNMILMFLDAVTITYMGEEIGMENGEVTCAQGQDPSAKNCSTFNTVSRDFERTPYQWDDSANAGFSANSSTWLPVSSKYKQTNLKLENKTEKSHYHVYQTLIKLKRELSKQTQSGDLILQKPDNNSDILQITRILNNETYSLVFNMGDQTWENVKLIGQNSDKGNGNFTVLAGSVNSTYQVGKTFDDLKVTLQAGDSMIIKIGSDAARLTQNTLLLFILIIFVKYF